jgi:hypothetical protein
MIINEVGTDAGVKALVFVAAFELDVMAIPGIDICSPYGMACAECNDLLGSATVISAEKPRYRALTCWAAWPRA